MRITHKLFQVLDGAPLSIPLPGSGSWNNSLSSVGNGRFSIPLSNTPFSPQQWRENTLHWFHMIAELWDGHPVFFGLIADKWFDFPTETLQIDTMTVDDLFSNRYTFGVGTYATGGLTIASQSLRAALAQILRRAIDRGATWTLPFDFDAPTYEAGGFSQEWKNHDWKRISDLLNIVQSQDGGPDIAFIPKITSAGLARWDVRIGTPKIAGPTIDLPLSVRNPNATNVRRAERGRAMVSGQFTRGEGGGNIRPFGEAGFIGGPPMAVRDASRDMVANDSNLDSIAMANLKRNRGPVEQWEFDLVLGNAQNPLPYKDVRLGTRFNMRHGKNAYLEAGSTTQYLTALSFDTKDPNIIRPEVQAL